MNQANETTETKGASAEASEAASISHNLALLGLQRYNKERKLIVAKLKASRHFYWQAQGRARGATKIGSTLWQLEGTEHFIAASCLATMVADSAQSWYGLA